MSYHREVLQMVIPIAIDVIERYKVEETLHIHHPCWNKSHDGIGNILVATRIFEILPIGLLVSSNQGGEILHFRFREIRLDVETPGDIHRLPFSCKAQAIGGGQDAVNLKCYLHGQMLIGRNLLAVEQQFIPRVRFENVG